LHASESEESWKSALPNRRGVGDYGVDGWHAALFDDGAGGPCASFQHLSEVDARLASRERFKYTFTDVTVASDQKSSGGDRPTENNCVHLPVDRDNSLDDTQQTILSKRQSAQIRKIRGGPSNANRYPTGTGWIDEPPFFFCSRRFPVEGTARAKGGASGVPRFTEERAKRCQESAMLSRTGTAKTLH
jgi:hypothetical protein